MNAQSSLRAGLLAVVTILLSACGAVGQGTLPVRADLRLSGGSEDITAARSYPCLAQAFDIILTFSNGERGSYRNQARWRSSNPAIARVSNGEIPLPDGSGNFYQKGVVIPQSSNVGDQAVITAEYLTFTQSLTVTIGSFANLRVVPTQLNLAHGSAGDLGLLADLDGTATSLDGNASWAFDTPDTTIADISTLTGSVTAVAAPAGAAAPADRNFTARARILGCPTTATATVAVSELKSIALTKEFDGNSRLVQGTTERLISTGTLANGATQDLSNQAALRSNNDAILTPMLLNPSFVLAVAGGSTAAQVTSSFGTAAVTSNVVSITPVSATFNRISVTPTAANISRGSSQNFVAVGEFNNGSVFTQPMTRHVSWSSSDPAMVNIFSNSNIAPSAGNPLSESAGLAVASSSAVAGQSVTITATNAAAAVPTATATVTVVSP